MGVRSRQVAVPRGRGHPRSVLSSLITGCALLVPLSAPAAGALPFGGSVDDAISPGEVRRFDVEAAEQAALHLRADHAHLDLGLRVLGPDDAVLASAENLLRRPDPLTLTAVAAHPGTQHIEVWLRSPAAKGGRFHLALGAASAASASDERRLQAQTLRAEADGIALAQEAASYDRAIGRYARAVELWRETGDGFERALTLTRQGILLEQMNRLTDAQATLEEALRAWRAVGDRAGEADCMDGLGLVLTELGDPRAGLAMLEEALALRRTLGPMPAVEGSILNDMAVALGNLGDFPGAIARYTEALAFAREDGDETAQALVLKNRAGDYEGLGESERALFDFRESREAFHRLGNTREEGTAEYSAGIALGHLGRPEEAWRAYQRALALLQKAGDLRFVAFTLNHMGLLRLEQGRYAEAAPLFEQALATLEPGGDRRSALTMRMNLARTRAESGHPRDALATLGAVRAELHAIGDRSHEASCLTHLARAEMAAGLLPQARAHVQEALRLTEELRGSIQGPSARATYAATEHGRYELLAGVLMALQGREPGRGWDAAALEASETARARSLLEVLTAARADVQGEVNPALQTAQRDLEVRTDRARKQLVEVLGRAHSPAEADAVERSLEALRAERESLLEKMRASSPRYAALAPARALSLKEIQERVLDGSTTLVEYLVGERQSFVWVVSRSGMRSAVLPGRRRIERAVTAVVRRWSDPDAVDDARGPARALSTMVLGPVADALTTPRLLVVADGPLQQVPFAALPSPRGTQLLIDAHTVVSSPSASVLAALGALPRQPPDGPELAILADPALEAGTRLPAPEAFAAFTPALVRSMDDTGLRALEPLPATRREARDIAALLPPGRVLTAFGPEASRKTAMGPGVSRARIVHFATHALLDVKRPELSGIVLSERDVDGKPQDGFLSLSDITAMRLSAELVVLSACRTGLGKEVRGEGLVGLTRGFMDAGAPRVVASLWKVSDRPTAQLMSRFYALLFEEKLSPAEALRQAQLELRKDRRTSAPQAWAGFVLQGDWRPLQTVGLRSPVSAGETAPPR